MILALLLVVVGTKDPLLVSCDAFVAKAQEHDMPITYWRFEGIGHGLQNARPKTFTEAAQWLQHFLTK
ncbi:MAG: hypothetical protein NTX86_02285 [Candidatus Dependentiae bacterium]|nr:hypothetical protein [Candidatus Dependentiae bacterium]